MSNARFKIIAVSNNKQYNILVLMFHAVWKRVRGIHTNVMYRGGHCTAHTYARAR